MEYLIGFAFGAALVLAAAYEKKRRERARRRKARRHVVGHGTDWT